ncbi:hypothetical protein Dimus_009414 [Dionaea muscipula]
MRSQERTSARRQAYGSKFDARVRQRLTRSPKSEIELDRRHSAEGGGVGLCQKNLGGFPHIYLIDWLLIWRERNERIFNSKARSGTTVMLAILRLLDVPLVAGGIATQRMPMDSRVVFRATLNLRSGKRLCFWRTVALANVGMLIACEVGSVQMLGDLDFGALAGLGVSFGCAGTGCYSSPLSGCQAFIGRLMLDWDVMLQDQVCAYPDASGLWLVNWDRALMHTWGWFCVRVMNGAFC